MGDFLYGFLIGVVAATLAIVSIFAIAPDISMSRCNEVRLLSGLETEYSSGTCTIVLNENTELDVKDYVQWLELNETIITD